MSHALKIESYCEHWPAAFAAEAGRLRAALGPAFKNVHHIGSTAVPGLPAKPIIDLLAEFHRLEEADAHAREMEGLGYEVMGEFGLPGRRYYRKNNEAGDRTHHVHAFAVSSPHVVRHLAFRNYLRRHPEVAREYGALKMRLVAAHGTDLEAYIAGKDSFVKEVERQALAWVAAGRAESM